jgi:hypothetical protein
VVLQVKKLLISGIKDMTQMDLYSRLARVVFSTFGWGRRRYLWLIGVVAVVLLCFGVSNADRIGSLIEEADGSPSGYVYKIKVSNNTLSISNNVATVTTGGGGASSVNSSTAGFFTYYSEESAVTGTSGVTTTDGTDFWVLGWELTSTMMEYLSGLTEDPQTQINAIIAMFASYQPLDAFLTDIAALGSPADSGLFYDNTAGHMAYWTPGTGMTFLGTELTLDSDLRNFASGGTIEATQIHDGSVSNTEFGYLSGVSENIQDQINALSVSSGVSNESSYSAALNGITAFAPSMDLMYDYLHNFDPDDDGSFADETWLTIYLTEAEAAAGYQPLESTLTDIADGTIAENLVNTANPWADNEVADTLTIDGSSSIDLDAANGDTDDDDLLDGDVVEPASTTEKGVSERATAAEAEAGTDDERYVTPSGVSSFVNTNSVTISTDGLIGRSGSGVGVSISLLFDTVVWDATYLSTKLVDASGATTAQLNSGPYVDYVLVTDADTSTLYGSVRMPLDWDASGVTFVLSGYNENAVPADDLQTDIAAFCAGDSDSVGNSWGSEVALDVNFASGYAQHDAFQGTAYVTPGNTPAVGDMLYWRIQVDAGGTDETVAGLWIHQVSMTYAKNPLLNGGF